MTLPTLDRAVLGGGLAQIAQLMGTYDSKTDQTAQTDQRIENPGKFFTHPGQKLTSPHPKLTSGTAQRLHPGVQVVGVPIDSAHTRPGNGAPSR
jgi:hypothetical protein